MISLNDISRLRELLAAGDPGPWRADIDDPDTPGRQWTGKFYVGDGDGPRGLTWCTNGAGFRTTETDYKHACNAELAAAAVTALPRLLNVIEQLNMDLFKTVTERDAYKHCLENREPALKGPRKVNND